MKVKELLKTVNVAWSPSAQYPILLAAGTAAQQLDASFNTSASLDLYSLNLQQSGYDMELKATVPSDHRFHKIVWGPCGSNTAGVVIGGCDYGSIKIYSAAKMLSRETDCLLSSPDRHTGPVRALDLNPFQTNLLASGATESEIYIWDIVNTNTPMTPGTQSQPPEDVQYIQWNKQVQHILASTFSQRCIIWDLRKNEPIIKLTDANAKIRWKVVQWHPEVATQLCLASEDDQAPIIQLWDLRFATSPLKTFQHHQRGVLSIAWNIHDPDLVLSCAKDNSILCWNPNEDVSENQLLCELAQTNQWNFDVAWCPRNPGLIVGSSFDGHATVYSLLGGQQQASGETSNKIVDSFPGMDPFTQPPPVVHAPAAVALKKAPKWLKKPVGASFGFGGKLSIFQNESTDANSTAGGNRQVIVSQVITNTDMIKRSNDLEMALKNEQFTDYCQNKIDNSSDEQLKKIWSYVGAYFKEDVTRTFLDLLGYDVSAINDKLTQHVSQNDVSTLTEGIAKLDNNIQNGNEFDANAAFEAIAQQEQNKSISPKKPALEKPLKINTTDDNDGLITQAILIGNIESAVSLCFASKRYADAVILSMAGGPDLLARTQYRYFSEHTGTLNYLINSLVSDNWSALVENCDINCWKETLVGIFSHANTEECSTLCDALGDRLALSDDVSLRRQAQLCYICSGNLNKMIQVTETDIQETVEIVMIMKRALEHEGSRSVSIDGNIAAVLSQYAEILASEGDFESAINYVGNGQGAKITMLRDRLHKAITYLKPNPPQLFTAKPVAQNYYDPIVKPQQNSYSQSSQIHNWNTNPLQNSYTMGNTQSWQTGSPANQTIQPPTMQSYGQSIQAPPPMPMQTPITSSLGGSRPSSVGPQSRPKYMIDPSVKTGASYSGYSQPSQIYNTQPKSTNFSPLNSYQPQTTLTGNYTNTMQNSMLTEPNEFKLTQPNMMTPSYPLQGDIYDPMKSQTMTQPGQMQNIEPVYQPQPQPSGWNDPPLAKFSRAQLNPILALYNIIGMSAEHAGTRKWKAKHSKSNVVKSAADFQSPNPISHPLRGAMPQQEYNTPEENYLNNRITYNQQLYDPNSEISHNKPYETQTPMHIPGQSIQPVQPTVPVEPEKPKLIIPEQHLHLKTVLDELRMQCYESAKNPQMKRKIEDVSRKLQVLYDCLGENVLSQNTLQGLHQISQMIQSGNYTNGLAIHTQLVSGPDFSQIASFMPGIKVLLQSALQLGVYIS